MPAKTAKGDWINASGDTVPPKFVPPRDKKRTAMVERAIREAEKCQKTMATARGRIEKMIDDYLAWCFTKEGVEANRGGNYTFTSFDGLKRVSVNIGRTLEFDDRIQQAKTLIDQCLSEWTEGGRDEARAVIFDAFKVNKKGHIDTSRILGLQKLNIAHAGWLQAMKLIRESITEVARKSYLHFQTRQPQGEWQTIYLDMAKITAPVPEAGKEG